MMQEASRRRCNKIKINIAIICFKVNFTKDFNKDNIQHILYNNYSETRNLIGQ
jgi:hypothetical protein